MGIYSKTVILSRLATALAMPENLYNDPIVNYSGVTSCTEEKYSEVISEELLKHISTVNNIATITRVSSYFVEPHLTSEIVTDSNRDEEILAKKLLDCEIFNIGKIFDFQVPLKNIQKNTGVGKIDLVAYDIKRNAVKLIELKYSNSKDQLLKAVLQINTYSYILDKVKFINDYHDYINRIFSYNNWSVENTTFEKVVLVLPDSTQAAELDEIRLNPSSKPYLQALIAKLEVQCYELQLIAR